MRLFFMLILITQPEFRADEVQLLNRMLERQPELTVHIRKPGVELETLSLFLVKIAPEFHQRLVIHQQYQLTERFSLKGIHHTTSERLKQRQSTAISTSFHTISEALEAHEPYSYFFCSPVFQSISKPDYSTHEVLDVNSQSSCFREKAVALGGISTNRLTEVFQLGFRNIAVLGSIWQHADPVGELDSLQSAFSQTITTFTDSDQL